MLDIMPDTAAAIELDPRWESLRRREAGAFFYSVKSTGVYCRPDCASRLPRPENVGFYATCEAAEMAGFRACKRCRPREDSVRTKQAEMIADICRFIEGAEETPPLADMAARAGLSPHHFHRRFKAVTGLTPKAYADAHRAEKVREGLTAGEAVISARSGALTVGPDGRVRGALQAELREAPASVGDLAQGGAITPEAVMAAAASAMAQRAGGGVAQTGLTFDAGQTFLGPLPVGPAPRIY